MSSSTVAGERDLRVPLPFVLSGVLLALTLSLVGCGAPDGSGAPQASSSIVASTDAGSSDGPPRSSAAPDGSAAGASGDFANLGDVDLEVAPYPVAEALVAEGGGAIGSMLELLGIDPVDVGLTLAVGPGGDPTISDWRLPGASAAEILEAWATSAPGPWSSATLAGVPALAGDGPDGSSAWAVAGDGRFVYIRTDDIAIAEDAAAVLDR